MSMIQLGFNAAQCGVKPYKYPLPNSNFIVAAPNGVSTAAGTVAAPTTLESAISKVPLGGTVVLRGGTYNDVGEFVMGNNKYYSLVAYLDESPVINGTKPITSTWTAAGSTYRTPFTHVQRSPVGAMQDSQYDANHTYLKNFHQVFCNGKYLNQVGSLAQCTGETFWVDKANGMLHIGFNPAGKAMSYSSKMYFANTNVEANYSVSNPPQIKGITFNGYGELALRMTFKNLLFENCRVLNCGKHGLLINGNLAVRNCYLENIGMRAIGSSNNAPKIYDTEVKNPYCYKYRTNWEASAIKLSGMTQSYQLPFSSRTYGTDALISNCKVTRDLSLGTMEGVGLWFDVHMSNSKIINCYAENFADGILHEISQSNQFYGNTLVKCNIGFQHLHSQGAVFTNNTIIDCAYAIGVSDNNRRNSTNTAYSSPFSHHYITRDLKLYNNLCVGSRYPYDETRFLNIQVSNGENPKLYVVDSKNNAFVRRNQTVNNAQKALPVNIYRSPVNGTYKLLPTVSAVNTALALEQGSLAISATDRLFSTGFTPENTKLLNAGLPLTAELAAIMDLPVGTITDIGAYQSNSSTAPTPVEPEPEPTPDPCVAQNTRIADLENSLADTAQLLDVALGDIENYKGEITVLTNTVAEKTAELATMQVTHADALGYLNEVTTERDELASQATELALQIISLNSQIAELDNQVANLETALQEALDRPQADCVYVETELAEKTTQLAQKTLELAELTDLYTLTLADKIAAQAEVEELRKQVSLESTVQDLMGKTLEDYIKHYLVAKALATPESSLKLLVSDSPITDLL